ncbi:Alanine aminotransferase 2 [Smittium mucronatum]|uniref:Alanine aminotransferase 2 n=1 Tax=Smittium mucronatum TaxID=133383 RepID=A0A1R0GVU3_9FUNG|nr:Alanine aminotransferase 2 [Smittium mucronatum]
MFAKTSITHSTSGTSSKYLDLSSVNQHVVKMEYAVRGALPIRAEKIQSQLRSDPSAFDFKKVVFCNIGNPQQLEQKPLTFLRQVSSLVEYPELLKEHNLNATKMLFAPDSIQRAVDTLSFVGGSVGAYSGSTGILKIRENVAKFIEKRDGFPSSADGIQLTNGASGAVERVLELLISDPSVGVMIPIPQYPLYTASLARFGARAVQYYLNEGSDWGMDVSDLYRIVEKARSEGTDVKALVVINPGNPTGGVLTKENMRDIVQFCEKEKIVLLADEVYQSNVYYPQEKPFISFKKVACELNSQVEMFSFHSISKGMIGECGRRGGYLEMYNIDEEVRAIMYKMASVSLCANVLGQIAIDIMVNPPKEGDASYEQYNSELDSIYNSLKSRSIRLAENFNKQENMSCNRAEGAMYLFPQIMLPPKFLEMCKQEGKSPDQEYSMRMLESTGVCVVPGSGFGQVPGTFHFRCTFLPKEEDFDGFISTFDKFHKGFMNEFRS